jgi:CubicO group peptidase (beta-lactamase class C family)
VASNSLSALSTSYGLGWTLNLGAKQAKVCGTGGLRAGFALYPNDNLAAIVLTNLQGAGPDSLLDGVAALYLDAASK